MPQVINPDVVDVLDEALFTPPAPLACLRRNAAGDDYEWGIPSPGVTVGGTNAFTGSNTFAGSTGFSGPVALTTSDGTIAFDPLSGTSAVPVSFGQKAAWYAAVTFAGPSRVIEFLGGTSGDTGLPYQLAAYFTYRGAFYSGTEMVLSNKRIDANGAIQSVSALSNGSELSMLAISPDVDGPSIAVESFGARAAGHVNGAIIAGYDLDDVSGGATGYSTGYGKKKFNLTSRGTMEWGADLGITPAASSDIAVERNAAGKLKLTKGALWLSDAAAKLTVGIDPASTVYVLHVVGSASLGDTIVNSIVTGTNYTALGASLSLASFSSIAWSLDGTFYGTKDVGLTRTRRGYAGSERWRYDGRLP
jgi:hypothetical protein